MFYGKYILSWKVDDRFNNGVQKSMNPSHVNDYFSKIYFDKIFYYKNFEKSVVIKILKDLPMKIFYIWQIMGKTIFDFYADMRT